MDLVGQKPKLTGLKGKILPLLVFKPLINKNLIFLIHLREYKITLSMVKSLGKFNLQCNFYKLINLEPS